MNVVDLFLPAEAGPAQGGYFLEFWTIAQVPGDGDLFRLKKWEMDADGRANLIETCAIASRIEDIRALIPDGKDNLKTLFLRSIDTVETLHQADPATKEVWA